MHQFQLHQLWLLCPKGLVLNLQLSLQLLTPQPYPPSPAYLPSLSLPPCQACLELRLLPCHTCLLLLMSNLCLATRLTPLMGVLTMLLMRDGGDTLPVHFPRQERVIVSHGRRYYVAG